MDQKRVYLRLEDLVEIEFSVELAGVTTIMKTKTRDISAGGAKVYLTHNLHPQDIMHAKIFLPEGKFVQIDAEVVSSELIGVVGDTGENYLYETRFKFIGTDAKARNELIQYIYDCRKKKTDAKNKES
ncbi:MAG: PilZ domain-containing protein [Candidatus Omnitrophota bacterium]